jgi:hypothetical protein
MNFAPVETLADLDLLDESEIIDGYMSADRGDRSEPDSARKCRR